MKNNTKAFTFVELIIVLVILAILSTIGFVVYESYLSTGRDTKRIVELKNLHQSLWSFAIKNKLPLPSDKIDITSSGNLITYHGNIDDSIWKTINFEWKLYDKELENYPTYVLGKNRKDFQLLNFVEDRSSLLESSISTSYAFTDYQILTPIVVWKPLGIFLDKNTKEPLQISKDFKNNESYDIVTGTGIFDIYMSKDRNFNTSQTGAIFQILPNYNCKRILEMGKSKWSGIYSISPKWAEKTQVYCDMRTDGGWWTMIARSVKNTDYVWNFGWLYSVGAADDNSRPYSLWNKVKDIMFSEFLFWVYSWNTKELLAYNPQEHAATYGSRTLSAANPRMVAVKAKVLNKDNLLSESNLKHNDLEDTHYGISNLPYLCYYGCGDHRLIYWWYFQNTQNYFIANSAGAPSSWLTRWVFNHGIFSGAPGIIFIR